MNLEDLAGYEVDGQMDLADLAELLKKDKKKYGNRKTVVDGIEFDSKAEAKRYMELITLQNLGMISDLRRQHPYILVKGGRWKNGKAYPAVKYIADFVYEQDGEIVVEDVKGFKTHEYMIKKKLMKSVYNIEIQEVRR